MTKTPEEWLNEVSPEKARGIFKLFLGYAPGVGKTYSMLSEAIRRASRGEDVVIGVVESHGRKATAELAAKLDRIPARKLEYKGTTFDEMDVDAILARKPTVVVVDELAHTNIEGSKHAKRYEDVMELLEAKIDVLSTMNVQHVESVGPTVQQITGVQVRETVPDWVMQRVDEIVLADLTPQALQKRMQRGDIYPVDRAQRALSHFFRPGNSDRTARTGAAAGDGSRRPQPGCVSGEGWDAAGPHGSRAHWGLRQFESGGSVSDRTRITHGPGHGRRVLRVLCRCRPRYAPGRSENAGGKHSIRRESGRACGAWFRPKYCRWPCATGARASHHAGDFRPVGAHRLAAIFVFVGYSAVSARLAFGRRPHRDPGGSLMADRPHILVVDDEPQITRVLRTSLSAQGYDIRVANSGEMALEIMKDWSPNLIITDLSMPSIDGVQLCRTVRARFPGSNHRAVGSRQGAAES